MTFTNIEAIGGYYEISEGLPVSLESALAKQNRPAFGRELAAASADKREGSSAAEVNRTKRWHALDRLLAVSFGLISPAYLFGVFPPVQ